jgi:hypothetical protein
MLPPTTITIGGLLQNTAFWTMLQMIGSNKAKLYSPWLMLAIDLLSPLTKLSCHCLNLGGVNVVRSAAKPQSLPYHNLSLRCLLLALNSTSIT